MAPLELNAMQQIPAQMPSTGEGMTYTPLPNPLTGTLEVPLKLLL